MKHYGKSILKSFLIVLGIFILYRVIVAVFFPGYPTEIPFWLMVLVVIGTLFFGQGSSAADEPEPEVSRWWYLLPISCIISGFLLAILVFEVLDVSIKKELFLFMGAGLFLSIPAVLVVFWGILPLLARRSTAAKKILDHNKIKNT